MKKPTIVEAYVDLFEPPMSRVDIVFRVFFIRRIKIPKNIIFRSVIINNSIYMEITIAPSKNLSNNRNQHLIGFKDISPQWFEKLNKILDENNKKENEDEIIHKLYPEINSYEKCVVGEAYGYDSSYVIEGAKKRCQQCVAISGNFSYYLRLFDKQKILDAIDEFTKHWNTQHKDS